MITEFCASVSVATPDRM